MEMTFNQYIINPMGIKNSVYSNKEMYRNMYTEKLDKILVRETGNIKYRLFYDGEAFYVLLKIPSEVIKDFYYDTAIMFYTNDNTIKLKTDLKSYNVKFYSNDPSFVYTFAHAMLENDLFIRDLVPRMSKEAVKKVATQKNPNNQIGYVKSIYFAYLTMNKYSLFQKIKFKSEGEKYNKKTFLSLVTHADIKVQDRQNKAQELSKNKSVEKRKATNSQIARDNNNRFLTNAVTKIGTVSRISNTKKTSLSNRIGTTRKISKLKNK